MTCDEYQSEFPLYVGHQLLPEEDAEIIAHLQSCALCRQALEEERQFARAVHNVSLPFREASQNIQRSAQKAIRREPQVIPSHRLPESPRMRLAIWSVAAALALIAVVLLRHPGATEIDHVADWAIENYPLIDQTHALRGDPATVRAWFREHHQIDISPPVNVDYGKLVGCKMAEMGRDPAPLLRFNGRETSAVFILPARFAATFNAMGNRDISRDGFRIVVWAEGGNPYLKISRLM